MEEIILNKQQFQSPPFGLHDAVITEMRLKDETVVLSFKDGITVNREPYEKTGPAVIEIRNVDPDFCTVTWLKPTEKDKLKGKRLSLSDFLPVRFGHGITVVSELHGYNRVSFRGVMFRRRKGSRSRKLVEVELDIYYFGDMIYLIGEK